MASVSSQKITLSPYARKIHAYIRLLGAITVIMGLIVLATGNPHFLVSCIET
jgi:hypothetical protein